MNLGSQKAISIGLSYLKLKKNKNLEKDDIDELKAIISSWEQEHGEDSNG